MISVSYLFTIGYALDGRVRFGLRRRELPPHVWGATPLRPLATGRTGPFGRCEAVGAITARTCTLRTCLYSVRPSFAARALPWGGRKCRISAIGVSRYQRQNVDRLHPHGSSGSTSVLRGRQPRQSRRGPPTTAPTPSAAEQDGVSKDLREGMDWVLPGDCAVAA